MKFVVMGFGVWAPGITGREDLRVCLSDSSQRLEPGSFQAPKPEAIPAKERRRSGLFINLGVEVAHQAVADAGVAAGDVPSVFASCMGDTAVTHYMADKLTKEEKLLSPTKFHNSVHNATSGYWSISAENRAPSSFIGGQRASFSLGLFEAVSQSAARREPVLLVAHDIATAAPFDDVLPIQESVGLAYVVNGDPEAFGAGWRTFELAHRHNDAPEATNSTARHPYVAALCDANPIACGLLLAEELLQPSRADICFASEQAAFSLKVNAPVPG